MQCSHKFDRCRDTSLPSIWIHKQWCDSTSFKDRWMDRWYTVEIFWSRERLGSNDRTQILSNLTFCILVPWPLWKQTNIMNKGCHCSPQQPFPVWDSTREANVLPAGSGPASCWQKTPQETDIRFLDGLVTGLTLQDKCLATSFNPDFPLLWSGLHLTSSTEERMIEGSLEVNLPTIWTDEKQSWAEAERREE